MSGVFDDLTRYRRWARHEETTRQPCSVCTRTYLRAVADAASWAMKREGWIMRDGKTLCPSCVGFDWCVYVSDDGPPVKAMFWGSRFDEDDEGRSRVERLEAGLPDGWKCLFRDEEFHGRALWLTSGLVDLRVGSDMWVVVDADGRPWVCDVRWLERRVSDAAVAVEDTAGVMADEPF